MNYWIVFGILIAFFTYCSAFFSASEIALFSLPSTKIKAYKHDSDPRRRLIAKLVLRPQDLIVTVFILNTLVNILLQNASSSMFGEGSGWTLRVGFPLLITLILGEVIPKYIAMQKNVSVSYRVAPMIDMLTRYLKPIREATIFITEPISRAMFFYLKKEETISKEELKHALDKSQESGILQQEEAELIHGYLDLQEAQVKEIMWPREDVIYYDINESLNKLVHKFVDQEVSRIPVCNQTFDNVLGILEAETYFVHRHEIKSGQDVKNHLLKPFFVPETIAARFLLKRMYVENQQLALAVDEYSSISGLVAREDLIEEVVGEIADRRDIKPLYIESGENVIIASAKLELSELEDIFQVPFPTKYNVTTLGGWITERLGEIPKSGTRFETENFLFQILSAAPNRIIRVYIRRKKRGRR